MKCGQMYVVASIPANENVRELIEKAKEVGVDFVELRLDYLPEPPGSEMEEWISYAKEAGLGVIVTVRHPTEGGVYDWGVRRFDVYERAWRAGADYCDVELRFAREMKCKLILSEHLRKLPPLEVLWGSAKKAKKYNAVYKLASFVSEDEWGKMVDYFVRLRRMVDVAMMPMGEGTERLRIALGVLGSYFVYGSITKPTAPGQVEVSKLVKVLSALRE